MADDLMQMQRQAAHRVQQMQAHSRKVFETYQGRPPQPIEEHPWPVELQSPGLYVRPQESKHQEPPCPQEPPCEQKPEATPLPIPHLDTEQWLLLGLALLLFRCGCRTELLLALLYLAL